MPNSYRWLGKTVVRKLRRMPQPPDDDALALLRDAIKLSGLSTRSFAETELVRDERTVRRWMGGQAPIPDVVQRFLRDYLVKHSSSS
jgi:hypothetical protein